MRRSIRRARAGKNPETQEVQHGDDRRISFAAILLFLAGPAAAATSINFTVKGNTVTALFDETDPADSCYRNFVFIAAADRMQKLSPGGSPVADVQVSLSLARIYLCNPEGPIPIISGQPSDAPALLLQVVGDLSSATLIATVPFINDRTSAVDFVQINLTFRATDKPEKTKSTDTFSDKEGGLKIKATSDSTQAPAVATGTVVGFGVNFTPTASDSATVQKENVGSHSVQKK